jgi:hypothetical protein
LTTDNVARARFTRDANTRPSHNIPEPTGVAGGYGATHPIAACVDLRAMFSGRFRFTWNESYFVERPDRRSVEAAWLTRIPCRYGFIAPHGGRRLMAHATTRRRTLAALPCVTVHQQGDGELTVTFDVADVHIVAHVLGAQRPRRVSAETRGRLRRQGFQPHTEEIFGARSDDLRPGHLEAHVGSLSGRPPSEIDRLRDLLDRASR